MPVFFAFTADGHQFDGCVATSPAMAEAMIRNRYAKALDEETFVGAARGRAPSFSMA